MLNMLRLDRLELLYMTYLIFIDLNFYFELKLTLHDLQCYT